jgi:hypothetical protein
VTVIRESGIMRKTLRFLQENQVVTHSIKRVPALIFMIAISAMVGWSAEEQRIDKAAGEQGQRLSQGKPLSYWLSSIRDCDHKMELAIDAIIDLGPDAWPAVEQLTRIVAEPFVPIEIGEDRTDVIGSKQFNMHLRADAIDALAAIGEAAATSTGPLIQWALTVRFIPVNLDNLKDSELFIDLTTRACSPPHSEQSCTKWALLYHRLSSVAVDRVHAVTRSAPRTILSLPELLCLLDARRKLIEARSFAQPWWRDQPLAAAAE